MLKIKKIFSAFVGMAMTANALITMPLSAFADEETSRTYTYDDYEVSYDVTNSWGNTEVVSVTLSNTGDSTIENWMLYFDPNGQVHDPVNAQKEQTSVGTTYFKNSGYNANVNPDSSVSFSYMVDDCEEMPNEFTLCQTRAAKESGYQVSLKVNQTWGDSFNGDIIIQNNTAEAIEAWELTVDTNFTITEITNSWAATVTELDSYRYMLKGTYTSTIYPNSSVSLGFNGVKSGDPVVTDYSLTEVIVDEEIVYNASISKDYTIPELEELNKDNFYPLEVKKNEAGNVISIDGKFSHVLVTDEKSALKALCSVKTLLGMTDPKNELVLDYIYKSSSADYVSYFFKQVYEGTEVYGRTVTIVARNNGETLSLDSNYSKVENLNSNVSCSLEDAKNTAGANEAALVVYNFDEYENSPVMAYLCKTDFGAKIISAQNSEIISVSISEVISSNSKLSDMEAEINESVIYSWDEYYDDPVVAYVFLDRDDNRTYLVDADTGEILNENDDKYQLGNKDRALLL